MKYDIFVPMIVFWGQSTEPQTQELQAGRQRVGCGWMLQPRWGESVDVNVKIDFSPYGILWLQFFIE